VEVRAAFARSRADDQVGLQSGGNDLPDKIVSDVPKAQAWANSNWGLGDYAL